MPTQDISMAEALRRPPPPPRIGISELGDIHPDEQVHNLCRTTYIDSVVKAAQRDVSVSSIIGPKAASELRIKLWTVLGEAHRFRILKAYAWREVYAARMAKLPEPDPLPISESDWQQASEYCYTMWRDYLWTDYLKQLGELSAVRWETFNRFGA